jgi:polyphosphate kinase
VRVRSLVGRFLEHSRIFRFGSAARGTRSFIGSADLMARNLDGRVEVLAEVDEPELRRRLDEILEVNLADDVLAWELGADGSYRRVPRRRGCEAQQVLLERARARAEETPLGGDDLDGA